MGNADLCKGKRAEVMLQQAEKKAPGGGHKLASVVLVVALGKLLRAAP